MQDLRVSTVDHITGSHLSTGYPGQKMAPYEHFYKHLVYYIRIAPLEVKDSGNLLSHRHLKYKSREQMSLYILRPQFSLTRTLLFSPLEFQRLLIVTKVLISLLKTDKSGLLKKTFNTTSMSSIDPRQPV